MKGILKYYRFYKAKLVLVIVVKVIGTVMDLIIPFLLSFILDDVLPGIDRGNLGRIFVYGFLMIVCSGLAFVLSFKANQIASDIGCHAAERLRNDLFEKAEKLSLEQIDDIGMPSLISRISTDTYNENQFYVIMLRLGLRAPVLFVGGIVASLILNVRLTLILLAAIPFIVALIGLIGKFGIPLFSQVQRTLDDLVRVIREDISGIKVIKSLSKEADEQKRFDQINRQVVALEMKSGKVMNIMNPSVNLIMNACLTLIILCGAWLYNLNADYASSGEIIAFISYFTIILNSMLSLVRIFLTYSRAKASGERIRAVFSLPERKDESNREVSVHFIEFDSVDFSYNKKERNLSAIDFTLEKGETMGILGSTGSGKTTILNLLFRFYSPDRGKIFLNYREVGAYEQEAISKMTGAVFQNDLLFNMSVRENILFYRDFGEKEVVQALYDAQADFVFDLPEGIDTVLDAKGNNLSGGQKQRILIARALIGHPPLIVLDDATSALDYKTDAKLRKVLRENYADSTQIIVSQRISSLAGCDSVLIVDRGKIVAQGSNEDLMETSPLYREIYSSQMGGDADE